MAAGMAVCSAAAGRWCCGCVLCSFKVAQQPLNGLRVQLGALACPWVRRCLVSPPLARAWCCRTSAPLPRWRPGSCSAPRGGLVSPHLCSPSEAAGRGWASSQCGTATPLRGARLLMLVAPTCGPSLEMQLAIEHVLSPSEPAASSVSASPFMPLRWDFSSGKPGARRSAGGGGTLELEGPGLGGGAGAADPRAPRGAASARIRRRSEASRGS